MFGSLGDWRGLGKKVFFFEKKNQKTFAYRALRLD
jgi:hypothetical protein